MFEEQLGPVISGAWALLLLARTFTVTIAPQLSHGSSAITLDSRLILWTGDLYPRRSGSSKSSHFYYLPLGKKSTQNVKEHR